MKTHFFPFVSDVAKIKELDLPTPETILQLLFVLSEQYGKEMKTLLLTEDNRLHPDMIVLLNGRHIEFVNAEESKLVDEDTVSFFSRIAGG